MYILYSSYRVFIVYYYILVTNYYDLKRRRKGCKKSLVDDTRITKSTRIYSCNIFEYLKTIV